MSSRGDVSVQPLAPTSRRASQQQMSAGLSAPHPYATAPSPTGYRTSGPGGTPNGAYGRNSPAPPVGSGLPNGSNNGLNHQTSNLNGSESYTNYGQAQVGKNGMNSQNAASSGMHGGREVGPGGARGMGVYDHGDQMQTLGQQEDDEHPRKKGFFGALCCRG